MEKTCAFCGDKFTATTTKKYCSSECAKAMGKRRNRAASKRLTQLRESKPKPTKLCGHPDCTTVFTPSRNTQKYCSDTCRRKIKLSADKSRKVGRKSVKEIREEALKPFLTRGKIFYHGYGDLRS